jgi:restriction system protein
MAIPDFQSIMLPLLEILKMGQEHGHREVCETLAAQFKLSDAEKEELLPSGRQARFDNRVAWSRAYLKKAGLIENTERGVFRITSEGLELLESNPPRVDIKLLMRYPGIREWLRPSSRKPEDDEAGALADDDSARDRAIAETQTPEEALETSYQELRRALAQDLIDRIMACSPKFFENLVVDLLVAMGYGGSRRDAGQAIGQSGDGGIDGIIKEDKLGLDIVYIQAKRWNNAVGRPMVQAFAGSLEGQRARKGIMLTTSYFSPDAKDYVGRIEKKIVLIDGVQLAQLMIDHDIGVTEVANYTVKRVDLDYFEDDQ